jgi:methylated-DNA-[protein]-cysteine S-methyltransferase
MLPTMTKDATMSTTPTYTRFESPIGTMIIAGGDDGLHGLFMGSLPNGDQPEERGWEEDPDAYGSVVDQLREYFAGERRNFDVPLAPVGTPFQQLVWAALRMIPYGETRSYGQIAAQIGRPSASRAVGLANGRNPVSIIVPCHRVIGSSGTLTGYAGGLERKRFLLDLERGAAQLSAVAG